MMTPNPTTSETPTPENCTNDLKYLTDLTVPDGSPVNPGEKIDKQWLVQNSGTCNWDDNYRLKLVNGFQPVGEHMQQHGIMLCRGAVEYRARQSWLEHRESLHQFAGGSTLALQAVLMGFAAE